MDDRNATASVKKASGDASNSADIYAKIGLLEAENMLLKRELEEKELQLADRFRELAMLTKMLEERKGNESLAPTAGRSLPQCPFLRIKAKFSRGLTRVFNFLPPLRRKKLILEKQVDLIRQSGYFDEAWYLSRFPDVAEKNIDPIAHYLKYGAKEGRDPSPIFSTVDYLTLNPDVKEAKINPLLHYVLHGRAEGRCIRITAINR